MTHSPNQLEGADMVSVRTVFVVAAVETQSLIVVVVVVDSLLPKVVLFGF